MNAGEVLLSYGDGRYLALNDEAMALAASVGTSDPLGKRIFDVAPNLRRTTFGRQLKAVLAGGRTVHTCERMPLIFPGARLSARIEPRPEGVHVLFRMTIEPAVPAPRRRNATQ